MSQTPVVMEQLKQILQLKQDGIAILEIARRTGLSRNSALALPGYNAFTEHPTALMPLIPFKVHGKIDPFNVGQFALQTFLPSFSKDKNARAFNIGFTLVAGALVALSNWNGDTTK